LRRGGRRQIVVDRQLVDRPRRHLAPLHQRRAAASPVAGVELRVGKALLRGPELRRHLGGLLKRRFGVLEAAGAQQRLAQRILRIGLLRLNARVLLERRDGGAVSPCRSEA
jgi:hypothetical protein